MEPRGPEAGAARTAGPGGQRESVGESLGESVGESRARRGVPEDCALNLVCERRDSRCELGGLPAPEIRVGVCITDIVE